MNEPTPLAATRSADRPRAHIGTSDAEQAIFAATEQLLSSTSLQDITVAAIIEAAGISRATFYFYFSSKFAVVTGLLATVMDEIFGVVSPFAERADNVTPEAAVRRSLEAAIALWQRHRPALRAIHEHWNSTDELRTLWTGVVDRFTTAIAAEIDRERTAGLVPGGPDSQALAAALLWGTESVLYVAGLGIDNLVDETHALEPLIAMWAGALAAGRQTGEPAPQPARPAKKRTARAGAAKST
jgi:TetR/AcrR family transcriptional regulator, ethionamide resistance regulator